MNRAARNSDDRRHHANWRTKNVKFTFMILLSCAVLCVNVVVSIAIAVFGIFIVIIIIIINSSKPYHS